MKTDLLGRAKFHWERLRSYANMVQLVILAYLFVKESDISWWWFLAGIPATALLLWFDSRYVVGEEMAVSWRKNPEWQELRKPPPQ